MDRAAKRIWYGVAFWLLLIFATSSTVIPISPFIQFVQCYIGSEIGKAQFAQFWRANGFFVVKGWHATEYAIVVLLCSKALQTFTKWNYKKCIGATMLFAVLFAASDEWHQTFVPGRDGCIRDVLIDSAGAALAATYLLLKQRRRVRELVEEPVVPYT
ncbi:MAG: VanZ family protein [Chthonomonadales bacterium]